MPVSKKPRKKGKGLRSRTFGAIRRMVTERYDSKEQFDRDCQHLQDLERDNTLARANLCWMIALTDFENVQDGFIKSLNALGRWNTTTDPDDFNLVTSSLMLGILIFEKARVAEEDVLKDMQHAAFMCVVCARLRSKGHPIPDANLESVRYGLTIAQEVMEAAYWEDRESFIDALKENSKEFLQVHPEFVDKHFRLALGRNFETVQEWDRKDPLLKVTP